MAPFLRRIRPTCTPFHHHELVELAAGCPPERELAGGGKGYFPVPALSHREGAARPGHPARDRGLFERGRVDAMLADPDAHRTNLDGSTWLQTHVG